MSNARQLLVERPAHSKMQMPELLLYGMFAAAILHAIFILTLGINKPLLDLHKFRQTQTALTTYWILKGGPWLAYETPVLGAPWSIPFEFPLYQLLTAGLTVLGLPLEIAGRVISYGFFLCCLWPLWILFGELKMGRPVFLATAILFLCCPLYLYFGRTFMIETCALFFALAWLALLVRYLNRRDLGTAIAALLAGCLALLAKSTTFPAFALIGCGAIAIWIGRGWFAGESNERLLRLIAVTTVMVAVPFAVGIAWVAYTDKVKMANQFGPLITSVALAHWNFGTLQQRLGAKLWIDTVGMRVIPDTLGSLYLIAFVALGAALTSTRALLITAAAIIAFLTPFLVFTNLHIVHNYYQLSNALFLVSAIGVGVGRVFESGQRVVALLLLAAIVSGQLLHFYTEFVPFLTRDYREDRTLRISLMAKSMTRPSQSLMVIGDDWDSAIPYYSERKALALPYWTPTTLLQKITTNPQAFLGRRPLGAIVACPDNLAHYGDKASLLEAFLARRKILGEFGGCEVLAPGSG